MVIAPAPHAASPATTYAASSSADTLLETLRKTHWGAGFYDLSVEIEDRAVYLRGSVPSYHLKQMAQTIAGRHSDGLPVVNWLVVRSVGWPSFEQPHRPR
jgi:hypothetical protein